MSQKGQKMEETKQNEPKPLKGILRNCKSDEENDRYNVPQYTKRVFISPRFSASDDVLFPVDQALYDIDKRWECISKQAGVHRQDGSVLTINHRGLGPKAFEYGMTQQASLRVRCLNLCLDHRKEILPEWIDVLSKVLVNLEHLTIADTQGDDIAVSKRMQRLYILYHIPNLKSIDDLQITPEERNLVRKNLKIEAGNRERKEIIPVEETCDLDDEEGEFPRMFSSESFGDRTATEQGIEFNQELVQKVQDIDLGILLERWDENLLDKETLHVDTETLGQSHIVGNERREKVPLQDIVRLEIARNNRQIATQSKIELVSVASSHHEWIAACGVLAFRSDRGCMPHIRLPFGDRVGRNENSDKDSNALVRTQAKKALREKQGVVRIGVCPSVPRQESIEISHAKSRGTEPILTSTTSRTKFFPMNQDRIEIQCEEGESIETISKPLPLVRMHPGKQAIQQSCVKNDMVNNELNAPLRLRKTRATSIFDGIEKEDCTEGFLSDDEDPISPKAIDW